MDEKQLSKEMKVVEKVATTIIVSDKESYEAAGALVIEIDKIKKRILEYWADPIQKAYQAHRALTAKRDEMVKPLDTRRKEMTGKINAFLTEQERIRKQEQDRLDRERIETERKEKERLEKLAAKAEKAGKEEKAQELREESESVYIPPAIVVPEVTKTHRIDEKGSVTQKVDISITVIDEMSLLKEIVEGRLPVGIVNINLTKLKQAVVLTGKKEIPGLRIQDIITASFRGSK